MPFTFNGCGTRYYGNRDTGPDGSYVTTEWITFVYLPLFPIRSMRVLPQGKSTNVIVYHSQQYQTGKVPLSWIQVRNVYIFALPILAAILYFNRADIEKWAHNTWIGFQPIRIKAAPSELPLDAASSALACGNVMKLEAPAFAKFYIGTRMSELVSKSSFTAEEFKDVSSEKDVEEDAFAAYAAGYLTWNKPVNPKREDLGKSMIVTINKGAEKLSSDDAATLKDYANKNVQMIMTAFDMGRHDARVSPCSPQIESRFLDNR